MARDIFLNGGPQTVTSKQTLNFKGTVFRKIEVQTIGGITGSIPPTRSRDKYYFPEILHVVAAAAAFIFASASLISKSWRSNSSCRLAAVMMSLAELNTQSCFSLSQVSFTSTAVKIVCTEIESKLSEDSLGKLIIGWRQN